MFDVDLFFELERIQKTVNSLNFSAFELMRGESIEFLEIENFAGFGNLSVEFLDLLRKSLFVLFLLDCELLDELLLFGLLLLVQGFALIELL
jgi:hypothetical protein